MERHGISVEAFNFFQASDATASRILRQAALILKSQAPPVVTRLMVEQHWKTEVHKPPPNILWRLYPSMNGMSSGIDALVDRFLGRESPHQFIDV
jgi:hypothetical protein